MIVSVIILLVFYNVEPLSNEGPKIVPLTVNCTSWFYDEAPELLNHTCTIDSLEMTYRTSLSLSNKINDLIIYEDTISVNSDYDLESFKFYLVEAESETFLLFQCLKSKYSGSLLDNFDYYLFSIQSKKVNCYSFVESNQNLVQTVNLLVAEICK